MTDDEPAVKSEAPSADGWLTVQEAAEQLNILPRSVRKRITAGTIESREAVDEHGRKKWLVRVTPEQLSGKDDAPEEDDELDDGAPAGLPTPRVIRRSLTRTPESDMAVVLAVADKIEQALARPVALDEQSIGALNRVSTAMEQLAGEMAQDRAAREARARLPWWKRIFS